MSADTPFQPSASAANPTAAPFDRIAQLERELAEAKAERDDAHTKLGSVLFKLPHDILCGDVRKWYEEHKTERDQLRKELAEAKAERDALRIEYESRAIWIAKLLPILGYENKDGFSRCDVHKVAAEIVAERDQLRAEAERSKAQSVRGFTYEELEVLWDKLRTDYDKARARVAELEQDKARLSAGAGLIADERARQIAKEGWTPDHDDEHAAGELTEAAMCYGCAATEQINLGKRADVGGTPKTWPWDAKWWKPSPDPVRNLVKAGALIAAEIDRLHRATLNASDEKGQP